jgi:hypothetical protein
MLILFFNIDRQVLRGYDESQARSCKSGLVGAVAAAASTALLRRG